MIAEVPIPDEVMWKMLIKWVKINMPAMFNRKVDDVQPMAYNNWFAKYDARR